MSAGFLSDERLVNLLVERELDPEAHEEPQRRSFDHRNYDDGALDTVAGAVALRGLTIEPRPSRLRERIER